MKNKINGIERSYGDNPYLLNVFELFLIETPEFFNLNTFATYKNKTGVMKIETKI